MLEVFICEDQEEQRQMIEECVDMYAQMKGFDLQVTLSTAEPQDILDYLDEHSVPSGLFFLDIDLGEGKMNGLQLGTAIRNKSPNSRIAMETTHGEMMRVTFNYSLEALGFVVKDSDTNILDEVRKLVDVAYERYQHSNNQSALETFTIDLGDQQKIFLVRDIIFFESSPSPHKVVLYTKDSSLEFRGKLKEIEKESDHFYRCHRSVVVNRNHIRHLIKDDLVAVMSNEDQVAVSRANMAKLIKELNK